MGPLCSVAPPPPPGLGTEPRAPGASSPRSDPVLPPGASLVLPRRLHPDQGGTREERSSGCMGSKVPGRVRGSGTLPAVSLMLGSSRFG